MTYNIISAGFGGQGVLFLGKMLAIAGMKEGKEVSWIPSYGPEMRGGTANCSIVISDKKIGAPTVSRPNLLIALNRQSLEKFEPSMEKDGILLYNKSLIEIEPKRTDIRTTAIKMSDIANELGNVKLANVVALGSLLGVEEVVKKETVISCLKEMLVGKKEKFLEPNLKALELGFNAAKN
jgi:2-oxoglutarate ferredoxin oxidoreductase subunit gamma